MNWRDPSGNTHPFNATVHSFTDQCDASQNSSSVTGGPAVDGSGYTIPTDPTGLVRIIDSNGTQVYPNIADRYGNAWSYSGGNLVDDTGLVPVIVTQNGLTTYYDVLAANGPISNQGTRVRYTVTSAPVNVSTQFIGYQQSDIHAWVSSNLLTPVQSIGLPDGSQYSFTYDINGELATMTLPTGGVITYGYTDFVDSSNTENNWVSSHQVGSNPAETFHPFVGTTCSNYSAGCVEYVIHHRPSGDEVLHQLTLANGAWNTDTGVYTGAVPFDSGHPTAHPPANGRLSYTTTSYQYSNPCSGTTCVGANFITSSLETTLLSANGYPSTYSQSQSTFDPQTTKLLSLQEWDYSTDLAHMSFASPPSRTPDRDTEYTYTGLDVQTVQVLDNTGSQAGLTTYAYTSQANPAPAVAGWSTVNSGGPYLQSVSRWLNTTNSNLTTTYAMDTTGMVTAVQDPKGNPSSFTYQCNNSLPLQTTNALQQTSQASYDCNSGAILSSQDPNDIATGRLGTQYAYDTAGRISSVSKADGGLTSYGYLSPVSVQTTVSAAPDPDIVTFSQADAFGRSSVSSIQGIQTETTYDTDGRVQCVSNPWMNNKATTCITAYDGLDRPLTQVLQDGTSTRSTAYAANTTVSTDEAGITISRTVNAFGKLTGVTEQTPNGPTTTTYTYDGLGNISVVTQPGVPTVGDIPRVRQFTYDSASRLVCASMPENNKTAAGQSICSEAYTYDLNGNMLTKTDANSTVTSFTYDALNRPLWKSYQGGFGSGPVSFSYDGHDEFGNAIPGTAVNGIGRLTHISNEIDAAANYVYDSLGRLSAKYECLPPSCSLSIVTQAKYNLAGALTEIDYPGPGSHVVRQHYDALGHLSEVGDGNSPQTYVEAVTHDPDGLLDTLTLGNGVVQSVAKNTRLQVQSIGVTTPLPPLNSQPLLTHIYCYSNCATGGTANNGSIWSIIDTLNAQRTQGFTYDSLNRISSFSTGQLSQQYRTDSFGNLTGLAGSNPILQFADGTNHITNLPCAADTAPGPAYDAAGNQLCDRDSNGLPIKFVYDEENRVKQLIRTNAPGQGPLWTYTYSVDGNRIFKQSADGQVVRQYVYFGGHVIAEHDQNTDQWTDSVYAGDSLVARAAPSFNALHTTGTRDPNLINMGCGTNYDVFLPGAVPHMIQHGDRLMWNQKSIGSHGGITFALVGGGYVASTDDAGQIVFEDDQPTGQWKLRAATIDDSYLNRTVDHLVVTTQNTTPAGDWQQWIKDVVMVGLDGTVTPYLTTAAGSGSSWGYCGVANPTFAFEQTAPDSTTPLMATNYYLGDHLGSSQLEFDSFGIPTWRGDFAPFGQPLSNELTNNHFQFTGLEQDDELQQHHAEYRQLAYTYGRWSTPDPYDGSMDLLEPQSFNRYTYVGNRPLTMNDLLGLQAGSHGDGGYDESDCGVFCNVLDDLSNFFETDVFHWWRPNMKETEAPRPGNVRATVTQGPITSAGPGLYTTTLAIAVPALSPPAAELPSIPWAQIGSTIASAARAIPAVAASALLLNMKGDNTPRKKPNEATCRKIVENAAKTCTDLYPFPKTQSQISKWRQCVRSLVEPTGCDF